MISLIFFPREAKSVKKGESTGLDGIGMEVLQNLDGASLVRLAFMYNVSLELDYDTERSKTKTVLIPMVGKRDYSSPGSSDQFLLPLSFWRA